MKNVFLEVINSVNLVNKKMNDNMKSLFSKYIKLLAVLLLSIAGVGQAWGATAGTPVSIFATDFSSATAHAYSANTAENITGAAAGGFDYVASVAKTNTGIAINSSSGGNSVNATGKFQAYANSTSYYWSAVEKTDFESSRTGGAPTALKIVISDVFFNCVSSGSNVGVNFAVGQGFANTYTSSTAPSGVFHSGFSIPSNNTLKFNQFNSTTNLSSTAITLNGSTDITWFINNTGESLTYTGPDGNSYTLADDKFALWTGTTKIVDAGNATTGGKTLTNLYIGSTTGKKHHIYFSGVTVYDISPAAACASNPADPTGFSAGSITATGATFTITDGANTNNYEIYYNTSSTAPTGSTEATTTSTAKTKAVTGLTANTTYYAWVRSVCDATHKSDWVAASSFTTDCNNPTQTFSNSAYTIGGSALDLSTLFSSNSSGAVTYTVQTDGGTSATIAGTSFSATTAGTATVRASQAANGAYCAKTIDATITVSATPVATYSITYDCDGAESGCPSNVAEATTLPNPLPSAPTKSGYTFDGWYTNAGKTDAAVAGATLSANVTLYAKWTAAGGGCSSTLSLHTPGKYESPSGYNVPLTTYSGRKYETYFFSFASSKLYVGLGGSYVTSNSTPRLPGFDGVANGDLTSADGWLNLNAGGFSGSNTSPVAEFAVSSASNSTHYAQIREGKSFKIRIQGYDQFSFGGRENGSGSGKQFVVTINCEEQTISHSTSDWNMWRFDLNPANEYIIEVSGDGANDNRLRAFSLRVPDCTPPANELALDATATEITTAGSSTLSVHAGTGNGGAVTYTVTTNPGSAGSVTAGGVFTASAPGTYVVTATQLATGGGVCGGTATKTINVCSASVTAPTISDATDDNKVTITAAEGTIYYTTDGSTPTALSATIASGSTITIDADKTIKAIAINACGTSSTVTTKNVTFNPCAIETMVWNKSVELPNGVTPSSTSNFSAHSSVLSAAYTGSAEEGSSLNSGSTAGSIVKISLKNPANVMDYVKFVGKIQDANLQYSTDEGANWTTLTSTNTGGNATYQLTSLNASSIWLKSTGSSGFWLRNMQIKVCEEACTPVGTELSASASAASVTGGSGTVTVTLSGGNGGTIVPATPANGTISAVDATHFTYTPAAVVTPTTVRLTFNQAKYSGYCAGSAYVDVTVNPSADPDIKVSKGSTEIAAGSSVDFTNVEIASAATTTTTETYTFTIEDLGLNDLEISSIVVSGAAFDGGCPGTCPTVSNGDNTTFNVSTVAGLAAGTYNGTVTINSNDPDENPYTFNIRYVVVPKYTVTVQFKTTAGASVSGATATIDGTTTSTNPEDVLVAAGLQTITCTEPTGHTFHHWQIVGGASSSVKDYEFNVTGDMTIRAVYSVEDCRNIYAAKATGSNAFTATLGTIAKSSESSGPSPGGAEFDGDTYNYSVKLQSSGYFTLTPNDGGENKFQAGDKLTVITYASGKNKVHGFKIHSTSGNSVSETSTDYFYKSIYTLKEEDIESNGSIKIYRVSSDAAYAKFTVERCDVETVPQVNATITPADNSNNVDVNSNIVVTLPDDFYLGADCEALTHIDITSNLDALTDGVDGTKSQIVNNIKIYKFNESTSSYDDVTSSFSGAAVGTIGTGVTVTFTHATPMSYSSQYRVEILNPGVSNELCDPAVNNISTFITGEEPLPQITVKDNSDVTTFPNDGTLNVANLMPADGYGEAVIKIYNTGTASGSLDFSSMTITGEDAAMFSIRSVTVGGASKASPYNTVSLTKGGDPAIVTIRFTKSSGMGTYHAALNIASNSTTDAAYVLNLVGTKIDFTLPYVYESGCTDPVADPTLGVRQDYTSETDVPTANIIIGGGAEDSGADANVIPHYSLWSSLGGCSQNGESAVRVGDRSEGKAIHIDTDGRAIGKITVKWAANGLRKISIENAAGVPFAQSIGWETSNECHTTTAFINDCEVAGGTGTDEVYIRVYGPEDDAMAAISYLEITPCDPEIKSSACDLINVTSANQQAGTSYTAQGTDGFIAVTDNCTPGDTFTPTTLTVSNGATISPKAGVAQTINAQGYVTYVVTAADAMTKKEYHVYPECQPVLDNSKCYESEITINSTNGGDIYKTSGDDKKIAVVATASDPGEACGIVMIDGNANGANHTVHYLDQDDIPDGGYKIDGPKSVCIGSVGTYRIINAPESNSPIYTWYLDHPNEAGFAVVGSEVTSASIASTLEAKFGAKATYLPQEVGEVLGIGQFVTTTVNVGTDLAPNNKLMDIYSGPELKLLAPDLIEDGEVSVALSLNFDFEDTNCRLLSGVASYSIKATSRSATPIVSVDAGCADENNRLVLTASQGSGVDVIEATKLDWTFSDPDVDILVASGNSVTVNIGRGAPDIEATVIASNGCGTTNSSPTPIAVPYGTPATTWIGKVDNDWNNPANWTRQVPEACTDVTIAAVGETVTLPKGGNTTVATYPVIPAAVPPATEGGICDEITFNRGAGVKGLENLSYRRAYVKNAYQRNKWYTLTNPLKEMVSGDYYFNGVPLTYMRKFDVTHSESRLTYTQKWTKEYNGLNEPLTAGQGFAYQVTNRNMRTPLDGEAVLGDQPVIFPRMTEDSLLITELHKYNPLTGKLMSATVNLTKTEAAYRFAYDNASVSAGTKVSTPADYSATISVPITAGEGNLSLIGNPMMCHLDLGAFLASNSSVIDGVATFWNGETNTSVAITTDGTVSTAAPAAGTKVAPMQAFFVKNKGAGTSVTFNVADHFVTDNGTYKLRSADAVSDGTLYVTGNDGETTSYLSVRKIEGASNGFAEGEDAEKIFNAYAVSEISTLAGGVATDINHFSALPYETPLAVNTTADKDTVDLTFKGAESFENVNVILVNKKTGEEINLKDENKYKFIFTKDEAETTLVLRFASDEDIATDAEQAEADASGCDVQIFTKGNNTVRVMSSSNNLIKEMSIFDAAGKLIAKEVATGNGVTVMDKVLNAGARNVVVTAVTDNCVKTEILQLK